MRRPLLTSALVLLALPLALGCNAKTAGAPEPLTVFAAGSLARPLRAALDSIAATSGTSVRLEVMGSREMLRAITSLGRTPDLVITADADEMERTLLPRYIAGSATFARNRVVLALSPHVNLAVEITTANWPDVLLRSDLRVARTDPARAPLGYRTQLVWALTALTSGRPGLADSLMATAPAALMRGSEADLAALLESGDADAAWCYESLARALHLRYVRLGDARDLGSASDSALYRTVSVRVTGNTPGDSITVAGSPIRYAMAIVTGSRRADAAAALQVRLLDTSSRRIMRQFGLDVLDTLRVVTAVAPSVPAP